MDPNFEQKPGTEQQNPYGQPDPYETPQGFDPNVAPQQQFGPTTITDAEARQFGMIAHLLGLFTGFIGPLVIYLIKKDEHPFAKDQASEALNFQITMTIAMVFAIPSIYLCIGIVLVPAIGILDLVFCIMATVAANEGKWYRYPINIRLVK